MPGRGEAILELAAHFIDTENYLLGYLLSKIGMCTPIPEKNSRIERWIYEWGFAIYLFKCVTHLGLKEEAIFILRQLLVHPTLPTAVRDQFQLKEWERLLIGQA
jgi:hypothetical protein